MNLDKAYPELRNAISGMLDKIDALLREKGAPGSPVKMYLAGGLAMNFYCGSRYTEDVDAFFSHRLLIPTGLGMTYSRPEGGTGFIYFDTQYNPTLGLLHESAEDDAVLCEGVGNERRCIHLYLLSPVDLAVTKISRFSEQDREDILDLARAGLITAEKLQVRAMEALSYYIGNTLVAENSIKMICSEISKIESKLSSKPPGMKG